MSAWLQVLILLASWVVVAYLTYQFQRGRVEELVEANRDLGRHQDQQRAAGAPEVQWFSSRPKGQDGLPPGRTWYTSVDDVSLTGRDDLVTFWTTPPEVTTR